MMTKGQYIASITDALPFDRYVQEPDRWNGQEIGQWVYVVPSQQCVFFRSSGDGYQYLIIIDIRDGNPISDPYYLSFVRVDGEDMEGVDEIPDDVAADSLESMYTLPESPTQVAVPMLLAVGVLGMVLLTG